MVKFKTLSTLKRHQASHTEEEMARATEASAQGQVNQPEVKIETDDLDVDDLIADLRDELMAEGMSTFNHNWRKPNSIKKIGCQFQIW